MSKVEMKGSRGNTRRRERRLNFLTKEREIWRDWKIWEHLGYVKNSDSTNPQSRQFTSSSMS